MCCHTIHGPSEIPMDRGRVNDNAAMFAIFCVGDGMDLYWAEER